MTFAPFIAGLVVVASALVTAAASAQDIPDWRELFPLEDGREWRYVTDSGTEFRVVSTRRTGGGWILTTTGFCPEDTETFEEVVVEEEGIRVVSIGWNRSSSARFMGRADFSASGHAGSARGYRMRAPLMPDRSWQSSRELHWPGPTSRTLQTLATYVCRGKETILWNDEERECVRVEWSIEPKWGWDARGTQWYAIGLGLIRGDQTIVFEDSTTSVRWDLVVENDSPR